MMRLMSLMIINSSCCFSPRYAPTMKLTNPPVVILSNYSPERVYAKALMKDQFALDSLLVRLQVVELTEPLDIDGFREAIARASPATTATPTTSEVVEDLNVTTLASPRELVPDNSTIEIVDSTTELQISTPPQSPRSTTSSTQSPPSTPLSQLLPVMGTPPPGYEINEDEFIDCEVSVADGKREETPYEKFMRERREKIQRKQRKEDAFTRLERKGKNTLFTGYN